LCGLENSGPRWIRVYYALVLSTYGRVSRRSESRGRRHGSVLEESFLLLDYYYASKDRSRTKGRLIPALLLWLTVQRPEPANRRHCAGSTITNSLRAVQCVSLPFFYYYSPRPRTPSHLAIVAAAHCRPAAAHSLARVVLNGLTGHSHTPGAAANHQPRIRGRLAAFFGPGITVVSSIPSVSSPCYCQRVLPFNHLSGRPIEDSLSWRKLDNSFYRHCVLDGRCCINARPVARPSVALLFLCIKTYLGSPASWLFLHAFSSSSPWVISL
jgi:hypothetical protein